MEVSVWVGFVDEEKAGQVAQSLQGLGYDVSDADCIGYAINIANRLEPGHAGDRLKVLDTIARAADFWPQGSW